MGGMSFHDDDDDFTPADYARMEAWSDAELLRWWKGGAGKRHYEMEAALESKTILVEDMRKQIEELLRERVVLRSENQRLVDEIGKSKGDRNVR